MKICIKCDKELLFSNFYSNGQDYKGKKKYKPTCKHCQEQVIKEKFKERINNLYGNLNCKICGYDKCMEALEFHHINFLDKEYSISNMRTMSEEKLKNELDKGVYLCANCHRETHYGLHPQFLVS